MNGLPPAARLIGIGWYFAICIVGGVMGGYLLDQVLGIAPLLTMLGLFGGLGLAGYGGYRMLMDVLGTSKSSSKERDRR